MRINRPLQVIMSGLAFAVWVFYNGGWFEEYPFWNEGWGTIAVVIFAIIVQIIRLPALPEDELVRKVTK